MRLSRFALDDRFLADEASKDTQIGVPLFYLLLDREPIRSVVVTDYLGHAVATTSTRRVASKLGSQRSASMPQLKQRKPEIKLIA